MSSHCILTSIVSAENSSVIQVIGLLFIVCRFFSGCFQQLYYNVSEHVISLSLSCWGSIYFLELFESIYIFANIVQFSTIFLQKFWCIIFFFLLFYDSDNMIITPFDIVVQVPEILFIFFPIFLFLLFRLYNTYWSTFPLPSLFCYWTYPVYFLFWFLYFYLYCSKICIWLLLISSVSLLQLSFHFPFIITVTTLSSWSMVKIVSLMSDDFNICVISS